MYDMLHVQSPKINLYDIFVTIIDRLKVGSQLKTQFVQF